MGERIADPNKHFVCCFTDCKATFTKLWRLEAHYCKHSGLKPFACGDCEKSFSTRYLLTRHQLSHSGEKKPYLCLVSGCVDAFSSPGSLKNHVAQVHHCKEMNFVCNHHGCGKEFRKKKLLKVHLCAHTNELPFKCDFQGCDKTFVSSKDRDRHGKVHEGYPCAEETCDFRGNTWSEYQKHIKTVHKESMPCGQCKKIFHNSWVLELHERYNHLAERRVFKCPKEGCEEKYTTKFNLQHHVLGFHEKTCAFPCPFAGCGKAFVMEESLRRHSVVHYPEKTKLQKPRTKQHKKRSIKSKPPCPAKLSEHMTKLSINTAKRTALP